MTPSEFFDACEKFDWYYSYSDDHRVWTEGMIASKAMHAEADTPEKKAILNAWRMHHFSGEAFGTVKTPKPELCERCEERLEDPDGDFGWCTQCEENQAEAQYERDQEEGPRGGEAASWEAEQMAEIQRKLK